VGNDTREDRSYYGTVVGIIMLSIEPWHFGLPWVTFQGHYDDLLTIVSLCAQMTCDLLAIAKFLVSCLYNSRFHDSK